MDLADWLLDWDPSLRWQVERDLLHEPPEVAVNEKEVSRSADYPAAGGGLA